MQYKKINDNCTMMKATWSEIMSAVKQLKHRIPGIYNMSGVYGVPRGGKPFAVAISEEYAIPYFDVPQPGCLIVDDDVETGATIKKYIDAGYTCCCFTCGISTPKEVIEQVVVMTPIRSAPGTWIAYPWTSVTGDHLKIAKEAKELGLTLEEYLAGKPYVDMNQEELRKAEKIMKRRRI